MSTEEAHINEDETEIESLEEHVQASKIITKYLPWSAGAGLVPIPGLDLAGITAIQVKMIADIAQTYNVPFKQEAAKTIIGSLLAAVIPSGMAHTASSLVKVVPGIGTILGMVTGAAFAAASTFALGRVFIQHFESGGNLITFDPVAAREYFKAEFENAVVNQKAGAKTKSVDGDKAGTKAS
jgi:uncharacterized protein (DUF697 family)